MFNENTEDHEKQLPDFIQDMPEDSHARLIATAFYNGVDIVLRQSVDQIEFISSSTGYEFAHFSNSVVKLFNKTQLRLIDLHDTKLALS